MSDVHEAEKFLKNYGKDYNELLQLVRDAGNRLKQTMEQDVIDSVYTREASGGIGNIFKDPGKIALKVRQRGLAATPKNFLALNDVIGLTIVVKYPDTVPLVVTCLQKELRKHKTSVSAPEKHENKGGYYATHIICSRSFGPETLNCEVQIKGLLHDAWSAKMHDLTYKPSGALDPKLAALMGSIASTIESLEQQSILIRDMIKSNWNVEENTRRVARHELFASMLNYGATSWPKHLAKLRGDIEASGEALASESAAGKTVTRLTATVRECCADPDQLRFGWIMAGRIASLRPSTDLVRFFTAQADAWLAIAPTRLKKRKTNGMRESEIASVPLIYYVVGDLDRAIDYAERLITDPAFAQLTKLAKANLMFNRATFLIEREYHHPTKNEQLKAKLKKDIEAILSRPALRKVPDSKSPMLDTQGLLKITFAKTQAEVRAGIEDCILARSLSSVDEKQVADAYADLNLRLGWRRYFELEGK